MLLRTTALLLLASAVQSVFAWGESGHRIIARLAAVRIQDPAARARILAILDGESNSSCTQADLADRLACVSTWADDVRRTTMRETAGWHFVNIPRDQPTYDATRDCRETPRGDCIVNAILRERSIATHEENNPLHRAQALKFVVHLIGDLTQPLHCINDSDGGGNSKVATWFGAPTYAFGHWNLHAIWDDGILSRDTAALRPMPAERTHLTHDSLIAWANAAHDVALTQVYGTLPQPQQGKLDGPEQTDKMFYALDQDYFNANVGVVERQLALAGQRLGDALNEMFAAAAQLR